VSVLPSVVRVVVSMLVAVGVQVKTLGWVGFRDPLRRLPAREVTVPTPMRMSVDMTPVPMASDVVHLETVAPSWGCPPPAGRPRRT